MTFPTLHRVFSRMLKFASMSRFRAIVGVVVIVGLGIGWAMLGDGSDSDSPDPVQAIIKESANTTNKIKTEHVQTTEERVASEDAVTLPLGIDNRWRRCTSSPTLSISEQVQCHIDAATARREQWSREFQAAKRESPEFETLLSENSNAYAFHVQSAVRLTKQGDRAGTLPFDFTLWATQLMIELDPTKHARKNWMSLVVAYVEAPAILLTARQIMKASDSDPTLDARLNVSSRDLSLAIRHHLKFSGALCQLGRYNGSSEALSSIHKSLLESFIDRSPDNFREDATD